MTLPADRPGAVVLLLAAGLVAALFAVTAFSPQNTEAQTPSTLYNIVEVNGGRSSEMAFKVSRPANDYLDEGDQIQIALPSEDFALPSSIPANKIGLSGSGDGTAAPIRPTSPATITNDILNLTIPTGSDLSTRVGTGEHLVITIERDSGIIAPETPKGFDDDKDGYDVTITFINTDLGNL